MGSDKNRRIVANYDETARISPLDILSSGRHVSSAFGYAKKLGDFLVKEMDITAKDRVLDAGCNVGIYHAPLARNAAKLTGVDASERAIERARVRNKKLANADYQVVDLTRLGAAKFPHRFDKILCYSVVHFLNDVHELEALLRSFIGLLEGGHGLIFIGEVREIELYDRFLTEQKNRKGFRMRDLKFSLLGRIRRWLLRYGAIQEGIAPTLFRRDEIEEMAERLGVKEYTRLEQDSWHPFANTCVDYRFRF